eukprot:20218-Heterococcus_DN1.PRE.1
MLSAITAAQATNTSARAAPVPADVLESAEQQSGSLFSIAQMDNNPFFTGGVGLAFLGAAAGIARRLGGAATMMARRHLLMTLEVTNKDVSFPWVLHWLTTQGRRSQHLSVNTAIFKDANGAATWRFDMMPGPGRHFIPYKNKWFWVERERQVNSVTLETGQPWEK